MIGCWGRQRYASGVHGCSAWPAAMGDQVPTLTPVPAPCSSTPCSCPVAACAQGHQQTGEKSRPLLRMQMLLLRMLLMIMGLAGRAQRAIQGVPLAVALVHREGDGAQADQQQPTLLQRTASFQSYPLC
jgi:hypothetical protein